MTRWAYLLLVLFFAAPVWAGGPNTAVAECLLDAKKRNPYLVKYDRYFWIEDIDAKDLKEALTVLTFQANQLSRRPAFLRFERAGRSILRINLLEIGWKTEVWEKFLQNTNLSFIMLFGDLFSCVGENHETAIFGRSCVFW